MNKTISTIVVIGIIIIGGLLIFSGGDEVVRKDNQDIGDTQDINIKGSEQTKKFDQVPAFTLEDWDGNEVSHSDFEGKTLVINSWAVWCPFCVKELAEFAILQEEMKDDVVVIVIDRAESMAKQKKFIDEVGLTGKLLYLNDPKDSFYQSIGGFSMPETIFVDKDGNIRLHKRGPMNVEEMRKVLKDIIE